MVFVPGAWHKPSCYNKIVSILEGVHAVKCVAITLPSTQDRPQATYKDDIDAARTAITAELLLDRDVVVVAHSYGGMVGNSAIRGLTPPKTPSSLLGDDSRCYVKSIVLIASGFTITGVGFMDPFFGRPPPSWRVNKDSGYAELVTPPRELFYHDVTQGEVDSYIEELTTQSLKPLFEGGQHSYAGWKDVPSRNVWYIGTTEDRGMPVAAQRLTVGMARGYGVPVNHVELSSSHSPFVSMPEETAQIINNAVRAASDEAGKTFWNDDVKNMQVNAKVNFSPWAELNSPRSWLRFGIPLSFGRMIGWGLSSFAWLKKSWHRA